MEANWKEIRVYVRPDGRCPFYEWLYSVKDTVTRVRIRAKLDRVVLGNLGDSKSVGNNIFELRMHYGPGFRIYFGQEGEKIIVLLCAGDKKSQTKDVEEAKAFWADYKRRKSAINHKLS